MRPRGPGLRCFRRARGRHAECIGDPVGVRRPAFLDARSANTRCFDERHIVHEIERLQRRVGHHRPTMWLSRAEASKLAIEAAGSSGARTYTLRRYRLSP